MPSRFVEVTNLAEAARKSDPRAYLADLPWNTSTITDLLPAWTPSNATRASFQWPDRIEPPQGVAMYVLLASLTLAIVRWVALRFETRRVLVAYGHAHGD